MVSCKMDGIHILHIGNIEDNTKNVSLDILHISLVYLHRSSWYCFTSFNVYPLSIGFNWKHFITPAISADMSETVNEHFYSPIDIVQVRSLLPV